MDLVATKRRDICNLRLKITERGHIVHTFKYSTSRDIKATKFLPHSIWPQAHYVCNMMVFMLC